MSRISDKLRRKISKDAKERCGYYLMPQEIIPMPLEIEHILPQAEGGTDDEENLWLACRACNSYKYAKGKWKALSVILVERIHRIQARQSNRIKI